MKGWRVWAIAALIFSAVYLVDTIVQPPVDLIWLLMVVSVAALIAWFAYFIVSFAQWREKQVGDPGLRHRERRKPRKASR